MNLYRVDDFVAFSEMDINDVLEGQRRKAREAINDQADDYILNVNEVDYIESLVSEFSIHPLEIHADQLSLSVEERLVPANRHPNSYWVDNGQPYPKDVYTFHLPFSGDSWLLKVRASTFSLSAPHIKVTGKEIQFEIINFNKKADAIKREADQIVKQIITQNKNLEKDVAAFNKSLESYLREAFNARKKHLLEKHDTISAIGVPIRNAKDAPSTFTVPTKRTPVIPKKPKPEVTAKGFTPEPTLDEDIYQQILRVIHDVGKQFERLPATYAGKDEEHLRDHILLILEPNFEGEATGETFNNKGKTDIMLRHEGSNVFVAELKYWHGKKSYLGTITQLLSYLTWRDSKAAVIMFVPNKELSPVLTTISESTSEHPNFLGVLKEVDEGWCQYRFHINGDENREVHLAVQAFHLPL